MSENNTNHSRTEKEALISNISGAIDALSNIDPQGGMSNSPVVISNVENKWHAIGLLMSSLVKLKNS